jgi:hypothetical protein
MITVTPHSQGSFKRPSDPKGKALAEAAKAACEWVFASFAAGCDLSLALGAWTPVTTALPALCAYRVIVVSTTGVDQQIAAFVDSPTLFDRPLDQVADAVLGHLAKKRCPAGAKQLRLKSARRSDDFVMVHGVFLAGSDQFEFVAFASRD